MDRHPPRDPRDPYDPRRPRNYPPGPRGPMGPPPRRPERWGGPPPPRPGGPPPYAVEPRFYPEELDEVPRGPLPPDGPPMDRQPAEPYHAHDQHPPRMAAAPVDTAAERLTEHEEVVELREEQLIARKELQEAGEVVIRTQVEEVPGHLEVEAYREEIEVEHVPVGEVVQERVSPWEEDGVLVVPVYEEQLVVVKRLVLREHLRLRRVATTEHRLYEDTLRRDRLVIDDTNASGLVHEQYPTEEPREASSAAPWGRAGERPRNGNGSEEHGNLLETLARKVLG